MFALIKSRKQVLIPAVQFGLQSSPLQWVIGNPCEKVLCPQLELLCKRTCQHFDKSSVRFLIWESAGLTPKHHKYFKIRAEETSLQNNYQKWICPTRNIRAPSPIQQLNNKWGCLAPQTKTLQCSDVRVVAVSTSMRKVILLLYICVYCTQYLPCQK